MQQTETYKLNLIESSDPFLPDALNENTQKIEEVVSGSLGDMDERIKVFEAKKFAYGTYMATTDSDNLVTLDFAPYAVLAHYCGGGGGFTALALAGRTGEGLEIVENGFKTAVGSGFNIRSGPYTYIALG